MNHFYLYNCPEDNDYTEEEESKFPIIAQELGCSLTIEKQEHTDEVLKDYIDEEIDPPIVYIVTFSGDITAAQLRDKFREHNISISAPGLKIVGDEKVVIDYE